MPTLVALAPATHGLRQPRLGPASSRSFAVLITFPRRARGYKGRPGRATFSSTSNQGSVATRTTHQRGLQFVSSLRRTMSSKLASLRPAKGRPWADYVPVCGALGAIAMSATLAVGTAAHEVAHAPNVRVHKKRREAVPEVAAPDLAVDETERFLARSLFRRAAQVVRGDDVNGPLVAGKKAVTLKDAGVEPPGIERTREEVLGSFGKRNITA